MKTLLAATVIAALLLVGHSTKAEDKANTGYPTIEQSSGFITRDEDRIYYEVSGDGDDDKETIVFCHGLGGNHAIWYQQVAEFAPDYRVITWDQRGFGRSSGEATNALRPATAAADLAALLDHLGVESAHVVGQSMGGWTVLGLLLEHHERVKSLVLADTIGGIYTPEIRKKFLAYVAAARTTAPSDGNYPLGRHPAISAELVNRDPAKALLYQQIGSFPSPPPMVVGTLLISTGYDLDALKQVKTPTLFIVGSEDAIFQPSLIQAASEQIPGSTVKVIPSAGHSPYFEKPAEWNRIVLNFMRNR